VGGGRAAGHEVRVTAHRDDFLRRARRLRCLGAVGPGVEDRFTRPAPRRASSRRRGGCPRAGGDGRRILAVDGRLSAAS
jgi:hypothetical protein